MAKVCRKPILKIDDNVYSVPDITANKLREYYSFVNINNNYTYEFMNHKNHEEIFDIIFPNGNTNYTKIFKINELEVVKKHIIRQQENSTAHMIL